MTTGVDCVVYVDGQRLAAGLPSDNPLDPTVLSGLQLKWGRATTVDQPAASTCDFTIMDEPGGGSFLQLLKTGASVDITSTGILYTDPTTSTITDPSFDATPIGQTPDNVHTTNAIATVQAPGGRNALRILPADPRNAQQVTIAPAAFSDAPGAWDLIPSAAPGQTWQISVAVQALPGSTISVQAVAYPSPKGDVVQLLGNPVAAAATGAWQTVQFPLTPNVQAWIGVRVRVFPTGPRWADMPPAQSWAATSGLWLDYNAAYVDDVQVLAPAGSVERTVLVFSGRITDLEAGYDENADQPILSVTAIDFTGDLDNIRVGDEPWTVESMGNRFERIVTLSEMDIDALIDPTVSDVLVSYQDVDSQAATGLLQDLAQSVDAVMWSAAHATTGPYIRVEDTATRQPLYVLTMGEDGLVVIGPNMVPDALELSACDVLRDPIRWLQNVADVATRAAVTWLEQGVDDDGKPTTTERTVTLVDDELEADYGRRAMSVQTLLQAEADALEVAQRLLVRSTLTDWRLTGLTIDDDESLDTPAEQAALLLLRLLDGTSRIGMPVRISDLPAWSPIGPTVPVYLEGGTYSHVDGAWTLELTVSRASASTGGAAWNELPAEWAWDEFDPDLSWDDLIGVGVDEEAA